MLRTVFASTFYPIKSTLQFLKSLPKIYTRKGDNGETQLVRGLRKSKDNPIFHLLGDVDELNSYIGICHSLAKDKKLRDSLNYIQNHLYHIGAYLATKDPTKLVAKDIDKKLENEIDQMTEQLPPLRNLIHPTGSVEASHLHYARTIARRVERTYVSYTKRHFANKELMVFFNRLSDYLFVSARYANYLDGIKDVISV